MTAEVVNGRTEDLGSDLGRPYWAWYAGMLFMVLLFGGSAVGLIWPGFTDRWFSPRLHPILNWAAWAALIPIAFGFTVHFTRRLWWQVTVRVTSSGICQSPFPGKTRCLRWRDVTKVVRPGPGNLVVIESGSTVIRLTQDAYRDPDTLYGFLARRVPRDAEGYERLAGRTP